MTRLDQLSRPRPAVMQPVHENSPPPAAGRTAAGPSPAKSMSKSMSHLGPRRPVPAPRPTKTEQLRRAAAAREGRQPPPADTGE